MRALKVFLILAILASFTPSVAWARDGVEPGSGGIGIPPIFVNPEASTRVMNASHHTMTTAARTVKAALEGGKPVVSALSGKLGHVFWSPASRRFIVLVSNERGDRVWKFVFARRANGRLYFVTNFYMSGKRALARAIGRALAEGAYRVFPPYSAAR